MMHGSDDKKAMLLKALANRKDGGGGVTIEIEPEMMDDPEEEAMESNDEGKKMHSDLAPDALNSNSEPDMAAPADGGAPDADMLEMMKSMLVGESPEEFNKRKQIGRAHV